MKTTIGNFAAFLAADYTHEMAVRSYFAYRYTYYYGSFNDLAPQRTRVTTAK